MEWLERNDLSQPAFTCSKLTIETRERQSRHSCVFNVNFEHISLLVLMFLSLILNMSGCTSSFGKEIIRKSGMVVIKKIPLCNDFLNTYLTFAYSKLTIVTLEKGVKYVQR